LLSTSTWDSSDKAALFSARIELTELAGFAEAAAAARVDATRERSTPAAHGAGPDELDSYEALVRDAGEQANRPLKQFTKNALFKNATSFFLNRILKTP